MKRLEGSKRRLDGSLVDVCRVDFIVFCAEYSRGFLYVIVWDWCWVKIKSLLSIFMDF